MYAIENLFLSIGAMKAATSWLFMQLREHPMIDAPPLKEIHYFAHCHSEHRMLKFSERLNRLRDAVRDAGADHPDEVRTSLDWYRRFLQDPVDDAWFAGLYREPQGPAWCAEFSNLNTVLPTAGWQHIRRVARNLRVLYALRDPFQRLWSHTRFHLAFTGRFQCLEVWTEEQFGDLLARPEIADHAGYARTLDMLTNTLAPEEILVVFDDDIEQAPREVLSDIARFLGIPIGVHDTDTLSVRHNIGPAAQVPAGFFAAAKPIVERELTALDASGFQFPASWRASCEALPP